MYKKVLFLFAFTFLTHLFCNAQINVQGSVKDLTTQEKIEFAHIAVQNASDTTKILYSAITDMEGSYLIENIPIGRYRFYNFVYRLRNSYNFYTHNYVFCGTSFNKKF